MDGTSIVALAGLTTTALTALGVPFIQGRIAARNAVGGRLHEQRLAAYTDAIVYMQTVEARLNETLEDPDLRTRRESADAPHQDVITARLRLVAPPAVLRCWQELVLAWDILSFNAGEDGPVNDRGDYYLQAEDPDVVRVQAGVQALTQVLRWAMGVSD